MLELRKLAKHALFRASLGFALISSAGIAGAAAGPSDADAAATLLAEQICAACHGPRGVSAVESIPTLAAQTDVYIAAKLWQFRHASLRREEPHLDALGVSIIDDATVERLARYFAEQPAPPPVVHDARAVAAGKAIFENGIPDKGVAACATCHGRNAEGFWIVPRLAGQHARYVERQLRQIQLRLRNTRVMHGIVRELSPADVRAVAAFVQSK